MSGDRMADNGIDHLEARLYGGTVPKTDRFFHYTSLGAMLSIVDERCLWATDIRYSNDAAEIGQLRKALFNAVHRRSVPSSDAALQFQQWLTDHFDGDVFAVSFSVQGDLLSQWRAYCPPTKGISLGFRPDEIISVAKAQSFGVGQCIYDQKDQDSIATEAVDVVLSLAAQVGKDPKRHPSQSYHTVFFGVRDPLLRIAALFKHVAFKEEYEWRAVSPVITNYVGTNIQYRQGNSMLIPFLRFRPSGANANASLDTVILGPTPHVNLAAQAVSSCLAGHGESAAVFAPSIPYRTW
jgi:hypothetical protein